MVQTHSRDRLPYWTLSGYVLLSLGVAAVPPFLSEAFLPGNQGLLAPLTIYGLILIVGVLGLVCAD